MTDNVDAWAYALKTALGVFDQRPNAGAAASAAGSGILLAVGAGNLLFLKIVTAMIVLDLLTGLGRSVLDPDDAPDVGKLYGGVLGKLMRFALIALAAGLDWTLIGLARAPARPEMIEAMIVTKTALVLLIIAEGASIISNATAFDRRIGGLGSYLSKILDSLSPGGKDAD